MRASVDRVVTDGRSPQGERGLKRKVYRELSDLGKSLPARGAWVETVAVSSWRSATTVAPRKGSVG